MPRARHEADAEPLEVVKRIVEGVNLELAAVAGATARLTILVDPRKKAVFERLCAEEDATPSQVVRRLIRRYIEERTGQPWAPSRDGAKPEESSAAERAVTATRSRSARREHE